MATKPKIRTLTNSSVDILNAIRNNSSVNYKKYVPVATPDSESVRTIGATIMDSPQLQNEFLNALVNRIGRVYMSNKMYTNPLAILKKGLLEYGETIEEIFVDIAKPFQYDPEEAENKLYKRQVPDVRSAFHIMNYQKFYKTTVQESDLQNAFLSWNGVSELIAKIIDSMYTGANYDEYLTTKYMLARHIINGKVNVTTIPEVKTENMKEIVSTVKGMANDFEFLKRDYNLAGVATRTPKSDLYILIDSKFEAKMDVEVLASAFNMDKADFLGRRILIDGFGSLDNDRLAELFEDDTTYQPLSEDEANALNTIPLMIIDKDYFMIFDNREYFREKYNDEGLYWNYWYHCWKTFSISPFANNTAFVVGIPEIKSVTVSPTEATTSAGQSIALTVEVETENYAPKSVNWSIDSENAVVNASGVVTVLDSAKTGDKILVTATSTFDNTKQGTATITVA